jgi:hypothetical protein
MPRFTLRQEIAAGFAAMICSAVFIISAVGPGTNTVATFI